MSTFDAIRDYREGISDFTTQAELEQSALHLFAEFGVEQISAFLFTIENGLPKMGPLIGKGENEWSRRYRAEELWRDDPALLELQHRQSHIYWSDLKKRFQAKDKRRQIFDKASDHGRHAGIIIPTRSIGARKGGVLMTGGEIDEHSEVGMALEAAARSMFDQSVFIDQAGEQPAAIGDLTPSELDVLKLLADGHQTKGIARLRGTSDRTVEKQIASAKEKLGGGSTIATVARAVRFNTI